MIDKGVLAMFALTAALVSILTVVTALSGNYIPLTVGITAAVTRLITILPVIHHKEWGEVIFSPFAWGCLTTGAIGLLVGASQLVTHTLA